MADEIIEYKIPAGLAGMIRAGIKLLGLPPEKMEKDVFDGLRQISQIMQIMLSVDGRLASIQAEQKAQAIRFDAIEKHLGIERKDDGTRNESERTGEIGDPQGHA